MGNVVTEDRPLGLLNRLLTSDHRVEVGSHAYRRQRFHRPNFIASLAKARSARIALCCRLLRRRSGTKKHVPSLLLSTAARDPVCV